jgi:DNA-binding MarR family transcriptional regulator
MARTGSGRSGSTGAAEDWDDLGGVLGFMRTLWAVDHGLRSASKRMRRTVGVTSPQRLVIRMVGRFPEASAGDLATVLHLHPSTLTGVLKRLERGGFLNRRVDRRDARRAHFSLTAKGRRVDRKQAGTVEACVRRALAGVSPRNLAAAREVLGSLSRELARG